MHLGMIQKLIATFDLAFQQLHAVVPMAKLEQLAVTVHKAMTFQSRSYHTLEHVFGLLAPADPIQTLAALYHDIVYYQVDRGLLPEIRAVIAPYIEEKAEGVYVVSRFPSEDKPFALTLEVFGFKAGQPLLPRAGLNEFLSALMMNEGLARIVSMSALLQMTLCIEATIPFRSNIAPSPFDLLSARLRTLNDSHGFGLTEAEQDACIKRAVRFANQDVESFAETEAGRFLDVTWKLMPETNPALRTQGIYHVHEYRLAMQGSEAFLSHLNADTIFHRYDDEPALADFQRMCNRARANVAIGREYLQIKLLTAAILEALVECTGGEMPLSLIMGDLPHGSEHATRLEEHLPPLPLPAWLNPSSAVYQLLEVGRMSETDFDLKNAPLSLFIYKSLPPDQLQQSLQRAKEMFANQLTPAKFLASLDRAMLSAIARASAEMVQTRREKLLTWAQPPSDIQLQPNKTMEHASLPSHQFLDEQGVVYERRSFPTDIEKGAASVARALGFRERQMVKTLIFESDNGERALIMLGGDQSAISGHLKKLLGSRNIKLASPEVVKATTGYEIGSIPPFHWQPTGFRSFLEASLLREEMLGVGTGQWGEEIIITPQNLVKASKAHVVNLTDKERPVRLAG